MARPHMRSDSTAHASVTVMISTGRKASCSASLRTGASDGEAPAAAQCDRKNAASAEDEFSGSNAASAANAEECKPELSAIEMPPVGIVKTNHPAEPWQPARIEIEADAPDADLGFVDGQRYVQVGMVYGECALPGDNFPDGDLSRSPAPAAHRDGPLPLQSFYA